MPVKNIQQPCRAGGSSLPQFLADHLRMEDVRLYLRDLLREYAALQTFQPFRSEEARCMNWDRMLAEFGAPHRRPNYVSVVAAANTCFCTKEAHHNRGHRVWLQDETLVSRIFRGRAVAEALSATN
jgi:Glycosyl transferase family 90